MDTPSLTIENLSKRYANGVQAMRGISLQLGTGMFGLLGPNGAGKSTLMRTVATLQDPDEGEIHLNQLNIRKDPDGLRKVLGYLPQEFGVYPKVTAQALLTHLAVLKGVPASVRADTVSALLRQTNLHDVKDRALGTYSGGMKQRFGIAQALLGSPQLIIADEPTAGLDPQERARFHHLLADIGQNVIVILSTHIVGDVTDLCTRMAIVSNGRVLKTGQPSVLVKELQGQTWRRRVERHEHAALEARHTVISTRLSEGRSIIHVLATEQPSPEFESVEPDLEDVYFAALKQAGVEA